MRFESQEVTRTMKLFLSRVWKVGRSRQRPTRRSRRNSRRGWRLSRGGSIAWATLLVLTAATFGGVAAWSNPLRFVASTPVPEFATTQVYRGPMQVHLTEPGQLESANNTTLRHKVAFGGGLVILKIADEGTWVKQGDLLVELDTSRFVKNATQQQIWTFMYDAGLKTAEARFAIQKMQNESLVSNSEHQHNMARLDLARYIEADYPQKRNKFLNEIQLATENLDTAQQGIDFDEKMIRKGYVTTDELKADRLSVNKARLALDIAREKLHILDEYTSKRDLAQREATAIRLEREVDRVKLRADASLNQRQLEVLYYRRWSTYFRTHYNNALKQIEACTIRAPHDGVVVYANGGASSNANESVIYEGAKVWENQAIVHLPDVTAMQVNARIHESKVLLVREGQPVTIHVDALPGESFEGVVKKLALGPMTPSWSKVNLKEYATVVSITDDPERVAMLRPGMTAEVSIHVEPLESVLQVPIQSCVERAGRHFAWVVDDANAVHRREIKVRTSNADAIEVLDGLEEGEVIALNPRSEFPDEIAALTEEMQQAEELAASTSSFTTPTNGEWPDVIDDNDSDDDSPPTEPAAEAPAAPSAATIPPPPTGSVPMSGTKQAK